MQRYGLSEGILNGELEELERYSEEQPEDL